MREEEKFSMKRSFYHQQSVFNTQLNLQTKAFVRWFAVFARAV